MVTEFVPPNWFDGAMIMLWLNIMYPLLIAVVSGIVIGLLFKSIGFGSGLIIFLIGCFIVSASPIGEIIWYNEMEVPSVQEKTVTIKEIMPAPGVTPMNNGFYSITSANQLMYNTTENEGFLNHEHWLFEKFETRDLFMKLKVNGTYTIKYYGWRNGYNNGFPNILSITKVVNETNAINHTWNDYFGAKVSLLQGNDPIVQEN